VALSKLRVSLGLEKSLLKIPGINLLLLYI